MKLQQKTPLTKKSWQSKTINFPTTTTQDRHFPLYKAHLESLQKSAFNSSEYVASYTLGFKTESKDIF